MVLRRHKLGEADLILTLLTHERGLVRAVAKGVRRTRSRFGGRLEPFNHVDLQLHPGRTLDVVVQAETIAAYADGIVGDYPRYTTACVILETAERLAGEERVPVPELEELTAGVLGALAAGRRDPTQLLDAYLLRAMGATGWEPALSDCAKCGEPGPHRAFHAAAGGVVCVHCRPPGAQTPSPTVLPYLRAVRNADWAFVDDVAASPEGASVARQADALVTGHLQWHLERRLRSLPLVER